MCERMESESERLNQTRKETEEGLGPLTMKKSPQRESRAGSPIPPPMSLDPFGPGDTPPQTPPLGRAQRERGTETDGERKEKNTDTRTPTKQNPDTKIDKKDTYMVSPIDQEKRPTLIEKMTHLEGGMGGVRDAYSELLCGSGDFGSFMQENAEWLLECRKKLIDFLNACLATADKHHTHRARS
eukprot:GDKI01048469.1.p1 GENE.GDKI01048469.1~~GDKI01048469.1.p1  ORF type:complete len:184 (-),score=66.34 GDKI01048469.1:296-847(-)